MLRQVKKRYLKTMQGAQNISFFSITSFIFMFVQVITYKVQVWHYGKS